MDPKPLLVGVLLAGWVGGAALAQSKPERIWIDNDPVATERVYNQLREKSSETGIDFPDGTPLGEVLDFLRSEHNLSLTIDTVALDELGLSPDEPVSVSLESASLGTVLEQVLGPLELTYVIRGGVLTITTEDEARSHLSIAVYPVADLIHDSHSSHDYPRLLDLIITTVAADTWAQNGGGEAEVQPYLQRGSLVVSQTTTVHEELAGLLHALRQAPVDQKAGGIGIGEINTARRAVDYSGGEFGGRGGVRGGEFGGGYGGRSRTAGRGGYGRGASQPTNAKPSE